MALGAGETTVCAMANAHAALANNGLQHDQTLVDYVQNRDGKVIWKPTRAYLHRLQHGAVGWQADAASSLSGRQVMRRAHRLSGGAHARRRGRRAARPLTLARPEAAAVRQDRHDLRARRTWWFAGGSQEIVDGVYLGDDQPRSLGGYAQGGRIAAPIFKQFVQADASALERARRSPCPKGVRMVRIDRVIGQAGVRRHAAGRMCARPRSSGRRSRPIANRHVRSAQESYAKEAYQTRCASPRRRAAKAREWAEEGDFVEHQGGIY